MTKPFAVFDADGVFLQTNHPGIYLERRFGLSKGQTERFHDRFGQYLVGKADLRDELPRFMEEWRLNLSADEFFQAAFESGCEIDPLESGAINALRKRNVPCGLATNQEKHRMASLDRRFNIRTYFDASFISCELGLRKPNRDFFQTIGAQNPGYEFFFWDDRPENVNAARSAAGRPSYLSTPLLCRMN